MRYQVFRCVSLATIDDIFFQCRPSALACVEPFTHQTHTTLCCFTLGAEPSLGFLGVDQVNGEPVTKTLSAIVDSGTSLLTGPTDEVRTRNKLR
jgi:hypothetical protein